MESVCLVFIFNHKYEQNIEKLRRIYKNRFSTMRFIVPFYNGNPDKEIISVYESSYYFEGYYIQTLYKLMEIDVDFFLFIADDLILNPHINEANFRDYFGLHGLKKCYLNEINMLNSSGGIGWMHSMYSSLPFFTKGVLWQRELPPYDEAMTRFEQFFGQSYKEKYDEQFFYTGRETDNIAELVQTFYENNKNSFDIPYPMAKGYSDVLIIRKDDLSDFSHMCGIFSSMDVFAEIAIPTSLVLLFRRDEVTHLVDTTYTAKLLWFDYTFFSKVADDYKHDFSAFYNEWNDDWLYVHPIKLSEWDVNSL